MADSPLPLTPRNSNHNTPRTAVQKPPSLKFPDKDKSMIYSTYDDDIDIENNLPSDDSIFVCPPSPSSNPSVAVNTPSRSPSPVHQRSPRKQEQISPAKAILENRATPPAKDPFVEYEKEFSPEASVMGDTSNGSIELDGGEDVPSPRDDPQGYSGMDDTNFTAFSAVPNADMTLFAQIRQSPQKSPPSSPAKALRQAQYGEAQRTPRPDGHSTPAHAMNDPYTDGSPSPSPRRPKSSHETDTTNLILDFTEQFNAISRHPPYKGNHKSPQKSQTQPDLASYLSGRRAPSPMKHTPRPTTPTAPRHLASLLDFDFPPAPTPRSIPSITARELESLKSSFLSQVSSLRATLSGKEAEANSLKEAVADAERRVGEALEEIRDLKNVKADLQAEKDAWGLRDQEMQNVLRKVKEEVTWADHERDEIRQKLEQSEADCLAAEARKVEVESQLAGIENSDAMTLSGKGTQEDPNILNESVRVAVQKLAADLYRLYKSKHQIKIGSLKERYTRRHERELETLRTKLAHLTRENEDLRAGKDVTLSRNVLADFVSPPADTRTSLLPKPDQRALEEERAAEAKRREQQDAQLDELEQELASTKRNNEELRTELEKERFELAELVAATEEMMQLSDLQAMVDGSASKSVESLHKSISRASSGLRAPSSSSNLVAPNSNISSSGGAGVGAELGVRSRSESGSGSGPTTGSGESRIGKFGAGRGFGIPPGGSGAAGSGGGLGVGTRPGFKVKP